MRRCELYGRVATSRRRVLHAVATCAASLAGMAALPVSADAIAIYFGTPNNAAYCGMGPDSPHRYSQEYIHCFTPDDGFSVSMERYDRPSKNYYREYKGLYVSPYKRLRFGESWRWAGFRCISRVNGLTCVNGAGHGWWLGRFVGYRLF